MTSESIFPLSILFLLAVAITSMVIKENKLYKKYRDKRSIVVRWDSWEFPDSEECQAYPAVVVECRREGNLFNVWYKVNSEDFKSVPIGTEIEIKNSWVLFEVQRLKEDGIETILKL